MKKCLRYLLKSNLIWVALLLAGHSIAADVVLTIDTTVATGWPSGARTSYTYGTGDVINYLNASTDLTTFAAFEASQSTAAGTVCPPANSRVQVNAFELVMNSTSASVIKITGTSSGAANRTLRAIYVNGTLLDAASAYTVTTFQSGGATTCGDITITGLDIPKGATVRVVIGSSAGSTPQNFRLSVITITPSGSLPVKLLTTSAQQQGNAVLVSWEVANESQVKGYAIERSTNGTQFTEVGFVPSANQLSATYSFTDAQPANATVYYRIKSVDMDGRQSVGKIVVLRQSRAGMGNLWVPNPVSGRLLPVQISEVPAGHYQLRLLDMQGRVLQSQALNIQYGKYTTNLPLNAQVGKGLYTLQLVGSTIATSQRIIME